MFFEALAEFAAKAGSPRVAAIDRRFSAPARVAMRGREGVGRGSVAAALTASGIPVTDGAEGADIHVVVVAETLKPEDVALVRSTTDPTVVVLNKADLAGGEPGGPLRAAQGLADRIAADLGVDAVPMIAPLADVTFGEADLAALRELAATPADMTSVDAFVASIHPVPGDVRRRLIDALDRFGLAHAVLAVADGAAPVALTERLRTLSGADTLIARLTAAAAPVRYRRIRSALRELRLLAAQTGDERVHEFVTSDRVVLAVMAAAVDVVEGTGVAVDRGDDAGAHTRRATLWHSRALGPLDALHRRCAHDITRGSLRLLARTR